MVSGCFHRNYRKTVLLKSSFFLAFSVDCVLLADFWTVAMFRIVNSLRLGKVIRTKTVLSDVRIYKRIVRND